MNKGLTGFLICIYTSIQITFKIPEVFHFQQPWCMNGKVGDHLYQEVTASHCQSLLTSLNQSTVPRTTLLSFQLLRKLRQENCVFLAA